MNREGEWQGDEWRCVGLYTKRDGRKTEDKEKKKLNKSARWMYEGIFVCNLLCFTIVHNGVTLFSKPINAQKEMLCIG